MIVKKIMMGLEEDNTTVQVSTYVQRLWKKQGKKGDKQTIW